MKIQPSRSWNGGKLSRSLITFILSVFHPRPRAWIRLFAQEKEHFDQFETQTSTRLVLHARAISTRKKRSPVVAFISDLGCDKRRPRTAPSLLRAVVPRAPSAPVVITTVSHPAWSLAETLSERKNSRPRIHGGTMDGTAGGWLLTPTRNKRQKNPMNHAYSHRRFNMRTP